MITKFEIFLLDKVKTQGKNLLDAIIKEKSLSDETEKKLSDFLDSTVNDFLEKNNA